MKNTILTLVCGIICAFSLVTTQSFAQNNTPPNPNSWNSYNFRIKGYADSASVIAYKGRTDTIAYTYHATAKYVTAYLPWAAPTFSSITIVNTDTGRVLITVKSRVRGHGVSTPRAWTTILTDSLVNNTGHADSLAKEFSLKDLDSDLFDGIDQEFMIILNEPAWATHYDTQGTALRRVYFNYKD